eukprot:EG_transcript_21865
MQSIIRAYEITAHAPRTPKNEGFWKCWIPSGSIAGVHHPGAFVIGADQMLVCGDSWLDKPRGLAEARDSLLALRGRTHKLFSAVCVAQGSHMCNCLTES